MPVNTAVRAVVRLPDKAAHLGVLCLRVGAFTYFREYRAVNFADRPKSAKYTLALETWARLYLAVISTCSYRKSLRVKLKLASRRLDQYTLAL